MPSSHPSANTSRGDWMVFVGRMSMRACQNSPPRTVSGASTVSPGDCDVELVWPIAPDSASSEIAAKMVITARPASRATRWPRSCSPTALNRSDTPRGFSRRDRVPLCAGTPQAGQRADDYVGVGLLRHFSPARAGFGLRLAATLLAALAAAAGVAYPLLSRSLEHRLLEADRTAAQSEAAAVRRAVSGDHRGAEGTHELAEALAIIAARPGTREAKLIEPSFRIAGSADSSEVGERDRDAVIAAAIEQGRPYFGRETDPNAEQDDFEYIVPLRLADGVHAFEVTRDDSYFDGQLAAVRGAIGAAGVVGLLAAMAAFWPLGGRRLLRTHRMALERATLDGLTQLGNHRAFQDELAHA